MQQDNPQIYYMVVDEKSTGPYTFDQISLDPALKPETLVWKPGIDNWVAAKTLPEFSDLFAGKQNFEQTRNFEQQQTPPEYKYHNQYNPFANNPQYDHNHSYHNRNQYYNNYNRYDDPRNGYRPNMRTNWLPWAIVATVLGFFTSCIGAIFGIIGIVQANKANTLYAQGFDREGDSANSNARIMTILGLIFAGLGIIFIFWFGNAFSTFANFSYL